MPGVVHTVRGHKAPIAEENDRLGSTAWKLDVRTAGTIEGFASATSVAAGAPISLAVRSHTKFGAQIFRLGWYHGAGGRLIETIPSHPLQAQPPCPIGARPLNTVRCAWRPTLLIRTASSWVSGVYLVKLTSADGGEAYVPFVLRERVPRAPVLVQLSVTTWQAYNTWGGTSLYRRTGVSKREATAGRARAVSFDRPYLWPGSGQLFDFEFPLVYWLESRGEDLAYSTDIDLDKGTSALKNRRVFISAGHDEYYSTAMRRALEFARDRGTNLLFLGANDVFRHIRFEQNDRLEVNYKYAREDPLRYTNPLETTGSWRDPPLSDPEQALLGEQVTSCPRRIIPWTPTGDPTWLFTGTDFGSGSSVPSLFGYEYDAVNPNDPVPRSLVVVARSLTNCSNDFARGRSAVAESTLYTASSGAMVFDAGSVWFDCALGPGCDDPWLRMPQDTLVRYHPRIVVDAGVQRLISNLLDRLLGRPSLVPIQ